MCAFASGEKSARQSDGIRLASIFCAANMEEGSRLHYILISYSTQFKFSFMLTGNLFYFIFILLRYIRTY